MIENTLVEHKAVKYSFHNNKQIWPKNRRSFID